MDGVTSIENSCSCCEKGVACAMADNATSTINFRFEHMMIGLLDCYCDLYFVIVSDHVLLIALYIEQLIIASVSQTSNGLMNASTDGMRTLLFVYNIQFRSIAQLWRTDAYMYLGRWDAPK